MKRRGQCRCGMILHFSLTSQGYKTRCPQCGAVVRLRTDEPVTKRSKVRKTPSAVLATPSLPPPPPDDLLDLPHNVEPPSLTMDDISLPNQFSFSGLEEHRSTAPYARVEMEAFRDPEPRPSSLHWWLLGALVVLVIAGVATLVLLLG